jgi:hypothetical protein
MDSAAQPFVFIAQLGVFGWQARRLRQTVEAASDQSEKMKQSIAESARAASAMENVAEAVQISANAAVESVTNVKDATTTPLRAYVNTNFAGVVAQNRETGLRYEPRLLLINFGHTPAHNVSFRATAAVLPLPYRTTLRFRYQICRAAVAVSSEPIKTSSWQQL